MTTKGFCFLHAADLHLDSPLHGLERYEEAPAEEIRGATRRAFCNLVRRAIELRVEFVILAGDVFDGDWKDYGTGLWFAARLRELTSKGIRVYLLAGNHDADGKMTASLRYSEGVHTFDTKAPQTIVDEATGVALHGQGFAKAAITDDLASRYPRPRPGTLNIGVLHTALAGRQGHEPYAPCTPDALASKGYDYWALGHVHQREIVDAQPWIVFPGNLQARHVRETGAKGATLVTVEDGRITAVTAEAFDVVRFARIQVDVSGCKSVRACEDAVSAAMALARDEADGRMLALRIELVGRTSADAQLRRDRLRLVAACRERANAFGDVWVEKVELGTRNTSASGRDIVDALELDAVELRQAAGRELRKDLEQLLEKMPAGLDLGRDGLDLLDETALQGWFDEARDEVVRRLIDADVDVDARQAGDT